MIKNGFLISQEKVFNLIKSVYESTDTFAANFEQEHASVNDLSCYLDTIKLQHGSLFLVAQKEKHLQGYILIKPRTQRKLQHTADLNMGVLETEQGKGLGNKLLNTALNQLKNERIIEILYLMVRSDNLHAIRLYEKNGFDKLAILSRDTKIESQYFDGILMRKFV